MISVRSEVQILPGPPEIRRRRSEIKFLISDLRPLYSDLWNGGVAQLGERLLCKQEVIGSNPFTSTIPHPGSNRAPSRRLEKIHRSRVPGHPVRARCLKGEERVCHVTEADRLGAAQAVCLSEEVSSCEAAVCKWGFAPVRGGFVRRNPWGLAFGVRRGSSARKGIWWMPWH